jgi:hypothetical protein
VANFWEIFEDSEDYPNDIVDRGVPQDTLYSYVSSTFLNGFVNYVKDPKAYLIERYGKFNEDKTLHTRDDGDETDLEKYSAKLKNDFHRNYSTAPDDIVILAHTAKSYWFFYSDRDCSDCCIGRISRNKFVDYEHYIALFKETFKLYEKPVNFIELPKPTGWITL